MKETKKEEEKRTIHKAYGHLGAKYCGEIIGYDDKNTEEKVNCGTCIETWKGNISEEVKKKVKANIRLFR